MANQFKIPNLGDSVDSGEVLAVMVKEGDSIKIDDSVIELETGKATIEIPSEVEGTIEKVHIKVGDSVTPGQVALTIKGAAGASKEESSKKEKKTSETTEEKSTSQTKTKEAAPVEKSDESAEKKEPAESPAPSKPAVASVSVTSSNASRPPVAAAPSVRKLAREIGVNISEVPGSGPNRRILIQDVKAFAKKRLTEGSGVAVGAFTAAQPLPDFSQWGEISREPMNNLRKMTAQHMALCWSSIPHVTQQHKADITDVEKMRKQYAKRAEAAGGKLTLTAMLLKIVSAALKVHPIFNASIDMQTQELVYKKYIHLGVAVDTPRGLVVPVIRDVDTKNIIELSIELTELAEKARNGKLAPDDIKGGTFTISNLGGIGGSYFTPIINHPEVAILGLGRGAYEPIYDGAQFVPRLMLPMSLSYDHRIIDGADGARFLQWIVEAIQEPLLVAMEG